MLVFFAMENHYSFKDRAELSFVPSPFYKELSHALIDCGAVPGGKLLSTAIVYGPNASGKSSLLAGLNFLRNAVINSHDAKPDAKIPIVPFALCHSSEEQPATLEIEFVLEGIRYHYGFRATETAFVEEWLAFHPKGRRQTLFEREGQNVTFGRSLKGKNRVIAELMRPNSLYLSVAAQNDHDHLTRIHRYLSRLETPHYLGPTVVMSGDKDLDPRIVSFLEQIGTGVIGFRRREVEESAKAADFSKKLRSILADFIERSVDELPNFEDKHVIELAHRSEDGEIVYFNLGRESAGTRRLLHLLAAAFTAIDRGGVLIVDELDDSLHTQVAEAILGLFGSTTTNKLGAQLLATTHDTNLMASNYLRRDQIWFTEKDEGGASHLFPLSDIRTRNTDNIERGYLQGRYGAIPFSGDFRSLIAEKD